MRLRPHPIERAAAVALACFIVSGQPAEATATRPNVLLILADDQSYHDVGSYGNRDVRTPNIDRLAAQGMRFTQAFTATAMCTPSRHQLYTGLFPVRSGGYPNHSEVYPGTRSIVHHLTALGYRVGLTGKFHVGPPDSFPFERLTREGVREFIARDRTRPYCLIVASENPHLPWEEGDSSPYDRERLTLPPHFVDTPQTRRALTAYYAEIAELDREVGEYMALVEESAPEIAEKTIFIYTSEHGAQFPRGKWSCYDAGLRVALVVRWPERVRAGSVSHALVQYVDLLPTLIEAAGGDPTQAESGLPGGPDESRALDGRSFLDVLQRKSKRHRDAVYGAQTTRGISNGSDSYPIRSIRTERYKLIWNLRHDADFSSVVLLSTNRGGYWPSWVEQAKTDPAAARLVRDYTRRPEFELYDVRKDPFELNNLASTGAGKKKKDSLQAKLQQWMREQGDGGIEAELRADERVPPGRRQPE